MLSGRFFPPPVGQVLGARPFLNLPAIPSRFIVRITVIAFHAPPRGVLMSRSVSASAIAR